MAKAASSTSRHDPAVKPAASSEKPRSRSVKRVLSQSGSAPTADLLAAFSARLTAVEEKITNSLATLLAAVQTPPTPPAMQRPDGGDATETLLPMVADLLRRSLAEHLTPITAALKRLEERIGFVSNRLKHQPGGQERQKPWRHDQSPHARPRRHNGPRPGQGQPWSPPSAASVQGHFAPRPLRSGGENLDVGEEEE
jgi:hypothetical protein